MSIPWRVGFEIELLASPGRSRYDLALAIAKRNGGYVRRFFHPQSEPSKVEGKPLFHNLTLGYKVFDAKGEWLASCVDDLTLQDDLDKSAQPKTGWYRILSDDQRLLSLIQAQSDPEQNLVGALTPVAELFRTKLTPGPQGLMKVVDQDGVSVAMGAPLPGERERPCELITAPLDDGHEEKLGDLLQLARDLDFSIPKEGATHIHFDASALESPQTLINLVRIFAIYGDCIKQQFQSNPLCRRLGKWPSELIDTVHAPDFLDLDWSTARERLQTLDITKYCDYNIRNMLHHYQDRNTIEIRVLPVSLDADQILQWTTFFITLLNRARDPEPFTYEGESAPDFQSLASALSSFENRSQRSRVTLNG